MGALACHFALFLVVFPGTATPTLVADPPPRGPVVLRNLPLPPPRDVKVPEVVRHDLPQMPFPGPTTCDCEPIVDTTTVYRFDVRQPVSADFEVGLPTTPPATAQQRLRAGADVELPRLLERVQPEYPELAVRARLECTVILQAVIGKTGAVIDVKILRGCSLGLDDSAANAVYQWQYTPTTVSGRPVEVIANVTVHFELH